ncbi:MAG: LPP20 family lipoprotein [Nitrospirae bacterium]|nr:LPP20 family lipoprotein [Nitrospirota bacterium]
MKMRVFAVILIVIVFAVAGCQTAEVRESRPLGEVGPAYDAPPVREEWVPYRITAKGGGAPPQNAVNQAQARLMAERAAKIDAMRNLLEQAYGVTIKSRTTVKDFITQNDTIKARVDAYIKGAKVIDTRYLSDGSVEIEMEIILDYQFRRMFP